MGDLIALARPTHTGGPSKEAARARRRAVLAHAEQSNDGAARTGRSASGSSSGSASAAGADRQTLSPDAGTNNRGKRRRARTTKSRSGRTALVLGGGGFTGGAFEIGALRALEILLGPGAIGRFDIHVGTSAGAFVASFVANGVSAERLFAALQGDEEAAGLRRPGRRTLMRLNLAGLARATYRVPLGALAIAAQMATRPGSVSLVDAVTRLADGLPNGLYDGGGIERYLRETFSGPGLTDDFRQLSRRLYLVATDIDSYERVVYGERGFDDVPISAAVAASAALPMVYTPRRIGGRSLVDGGIFSTTNIDVAVAHGAELVVVLNPLVPYRNLRGEGAEATETLADRGFAPIGYQAFKMLAHERLQRAALSWQERFPGTDILLIEPDPDDRLMFETHILDFARARTVARRAFRTVGARLLEQSDKLAPIWARHGISADPVRLRRALGSLPRRRRGSRLGHIVTVPARAGRAFAAGVR